jgi:hypothetical protein
VPDPDSKNRAIFVYFGSHKPLPINLSKQVKRMIRQNLPVQTCPVDAWKVVNGGIIHILDVKVLLSHESEFRLWLICIVPIVGN